MGGLGLGNHVSLGLTLAFFLLVVLLDWRRVRAVIMPGLAAGLFGLSIYSYIPVRALADPPLNTGAAVTWKRFAAQVTDLRDRALRWGGEQTEAAPSAAVLPAVSPAVPPKTVSAKLQTYVSRLAADAGNDFGKLSRELHPLVLLAALLGILALFVALPREGLVVAGMALTNWLFFRGWTPDPWIPLSLAAALGAAVLTGLAVAGLQRAVSMRAGSLAAAVVYAALFASAPAAPGRTLSELRGLELPADFSRGLLRPLPVGAVYLTENSWFLLKYLNAVEGYRADVTLVYALDVTFPEYFRPLILTARTDVTVYPPGGDAAAPPAERVVPAERAVQRTGAFIDAASKAAALIAFEPNRNLNRFLKTVARLEAGGYGVIERGRVAALDPEYAAAVSSSWLAPKEILVGLSSSAYKDSTFFFEQRAVNTADLLSVQEHYSAAEDLLSAACLPLPATPCSEAGLNNLAVARIKNGRFPAAAALLIDLMRLKHMRSSGLLQNLAVAINNLTVAEQAALKQDPFAGVVLKQMGY